MKIVYVTDNYVSPTLGGIDRITYVMAGILHTRYGYQCYSIHALAATEVLPDKTVFLDRYRWKSKQEYIGYIQKIGECVIVLQSPCTLAKEIFDAKVFLPDAKLVNVFHGVPGFELVPLSRDIIAYRLLHGIELKWTIKQCIIQVGMRTFMKKYILKTIKNKYARPYGVADRIVVLSKGIIDQYQASALGNRDDFMVIPNALTFDDPPVNSTSYTHKEVLVVSRLDDWHKRILMVLKIWAIVQRNNRYKDWVLRIVGDGIDRPCYEDYVNRYHITNIIFEGRQNPIQYYQHASVFLMTSACEGWGLTLTEAQQCGCVPVVFDTYASLPDIVTDGRNGFIVPEGDIDQYVARLTQLMNDEDLRKQMASNAMIDCQRYTPQKVAAQWHKLFTELAK